MNTLLLNTGEPMPAFGLGTWQLTGEQCTEAVKTALAKGYTHIDTAEAYGNEAEIGKALAESDVDRSKLFITSKLWMSHYSRDEAIKACDASLQKLGTDYLDLYLMQWPDSSQDLKQTMLAMKDLLDAGKIRSFGVSNFTIKHLEKAISAAREVGIPISVNQVEFHPGLHQEELLDYCRENGIILTAYSPIARGNLSQDKVLQDIGSRHNKSPEQVALRWIVQKDMIAIPKSSNAQHIEDNMHIFDFQLSDEEMKKIDALGSNKRLIVPGFAEFDKAEVY